MNVTPKQRQQKQTDKLNYVNLKTFCTTKVTTEWKGNLQNGRNYFQESLRVIKPAMHATVGVPFLHLRLLPIYFVPDVKWETITQIHWLVVPSKQ